MDFLNSYRKRKKRISRRHGLRHRPQWTSIGWRWWWRRSQKLFICYVLCIKVGSSDILDINMKQDIERIFHFSSENGSIHDSILFTYKMILLRTTSAFSIRKYSTINLYKLCNNIIIIEVTSSHRIILYLSNKCRTSKDLS